MSYCVVFKLVLAAVGDYRIVADHRTKTGPRLHYTLYPLSLTEHDQHIMKMEPTHVPHPNVADRFASAFNLPLDYYITYVLATIYIEST